MTADAMAKLRSALGDAPDIEFVAVTQGTQGQGVRYLCHGDDELDFVRVGDLRTLLARLEVAEADARRYRALAHHAGHCFCQADTGRAWYYSGPVADLTLNMPTMDEYADAIAAKLDHAMRGGA